MATPLLLVVHGRSGGLIPEVFLQLARELEQRRQGPVALQALTAPLAAVGTDRASGLTLVPLLLLPGNHARVDVPALARQLAPGPAAAVLGRSSPGSVPAATADASAEKRLAAGPGGEPEFRTGSASSLGWAKQSALRLRRLPFLGAWPAWQRALAAELAALAAPVASGARPVAQPPLLLHHPLEGPLAFRYLAHLQRSVGCRCLAAPYSSQDSEELALAIDGPVLPLALAANRLTERLEPQLGRRRAMPLLERPRLRQVLIEQLAALP